MIELLQSIVTAISSIPLAIWTAVIGAAIALFSVHLTSKGNTDRLQKQLGHDREQKEKDRLAALRRDVYLRAPQEAMKAMFYLAKLPGRDLTTIGDDEGITGFASVAAQIAVLSDIPTVRAVNSLGNTLTHHLMDALKELQAVQDARSSGNIHQERTDVVMAEIQRLQADQQHMLELAQFDAARDASLKFWIEARLEEAKVLRKKVNKYRSLELKLLHEYHLTAAARVRVIADGNIAVLRAVRKELGLADDHGAFEKQMRESADDLNAKLLQMTKRWAEDMARDNDDDDDDDDEEVE